MAIESRYVVGIVAVVLLAGFAIGMVGSPAGWRLRPFETVVALRHGAAPGMTIRDGLRGSAAEPVAVATMASTTSGMATTVATTTPTTAPPTTPTAPPRTRMSERESYGFFSEDEAVWRRRKDRHDKQMAIEAANPGWNAMASGRTFFQGHFEPTFTCVNERRVGNYGDGGKWVCDPDRIVDKISKGDGCLVYSIGSSGDYSFERHVHDQISDKCEIYTFDMKHWSAYTNVAPPDYVHYIVATIGGNPPAKSVGKLVQELGHQNRTIDIFKIDCEGCEWSSYRTWLDNGVFLRQIQVELHVFQGVTQIFDMFRFLFSLGYVVFHKEPNTQYSGGDCIEFAFLRLHPDFGSVKLPR